MPPLCDEPEERLTEPLRDEPKEPDERLPAEERTVEEWTLRVTGAVWRCMVVRDGDVVVLR